MGLYLGFINLFQDDLISKNNIPGLTEGNREIPDVKKKLTRKGDLDISVPRQAAICTRSLIR
jgi:hypothetical protein